MRKRLLESIAVAVVLLAVTVLLKLAPVPVAGPTSLLGSYVEARQSLGGGGQIPALKTPWGEPDLQGIWSDEFQIPLERPAQFAGKATLTDAERTELDKQRGAQPHFGDRLASRGTEQDVSGAYNSVFTSQRRTGRRTSLIIDPPDGKIPSLTPEAIKRRNAIRQFQLALLQATEVCKNKVRGACKDGTYGPPSPRRAETPPHYLTTAVNRASGPEDRSLGERCMSGSLPDFAGGFVGVYRRLVQSPGFVSIYYDAGQGQGWQRIIPITDAPHLPSHIRQWWGDSRGRWEGNTLVVDVTNFTSKTDYQGSRENLHLVERWTRTGPNSLELVATMEDPTTWTRPWTVKQEFSKQSNEANRIYTEPRCHEGNFGLVGLLMGSRVEEKEFAEGRGPDPATRCSAGCGFDPEGVADPLALR